MHFLEKKGRMNSDIYLNQVLKELGLPFYKQHIREKGPMIWIDDSARYHTSKTTDAHRRRVRLIRIDWPALSPDLNSIENL